MGKKKETPVDAARKERVKCVFVRSKDATPVCEREYDRIPDFKVEMDKAFGRLKLQEGEVCFVNVYVVYGEGHRGRKPNTDKPVATQYWFGKGAK